MVLFFVFLCFVRNGMNFNFRRKKLCHRFAKRIVVDMAWTLQGETAEELPERMLCGVTIHRMDFSKCLESEEEMEQCPKLKYKEKKKEKK